MTKASLRLRWGCSLIWGLMLGFAGFMAFLAFPAVPLTAGSSEVSVPGTPIVVYTKLARGIRRCWFGADGVFANGYLFRATVPPPAKNAGAKLGIYTKNPKGRLGRVVLQVELNSYGEDTKVAINTRAFSTEAEEILRTRMTRWARVNRQVDFGAECGPPSEAVLLLASSAETSDTMKRLSKPKWRPPLPRRTPIK